MLGYWICAVAMRKELHSLKKDEKPVFNMDITKYCPDVWKLKRNADIFMDDDEISKELYYQSYYLCKVIGYQIGLEVSRKKKRKNT